MTTALELAQRWAEAPNILIVEDDDDTACLVKDMLGRYDCEVSVALTLRSALQCVNEREFDLVFVDLLLPDGEGTVLIKQLKTTSPSTPIVVMTGVLDSRVIEEALRCGVVALLRKPYDMTLQHFRDVLNMFKIRTRPIRLLSAA